MKFNYPAGATPLSPEELEGLIPEEITTQGDLNAWEQQNILDGRQRLAQRGPGELLSDEAIKTAHRRMFGETWRWAGQYRTSGKNIGVDWARIPEEIRLLCEDMRYQREHHTYPVDEFATRFHHRLVSVHPFANGNGRHARLMTDLLLKSLGSPAFTWGRADLNRDGDARDYYLAALRTADAHDYGPLSGFVRS
ncbi:MAG TPA: mobile mystery protein B [Gammaproteobacteria bacterium]|nr:mobile mystery protein B [Gammaproteobacteria bacterium]